MTKRWKVALGFVVGVPVLACLSVGVYMEAVFGRAASSRDEELAAAQREGIPATPAALRALTHVPDRENAAPLYKQAEALIQKGGPYGKDVSAVTSAMRPEATATDVAGGASALERLRPVLAFTRQAAAKPHLDAKTQWERGPDIAFPEFASKKLLARLLCFDADRRSKVGDWRNALIDIAAAQRISRHLGEEPTLISMLVQIAIEGIVDTTFDRIVDEHAHDAVFLSAAKEIHDGFGPLPNFRYAMYGELECGRSAIPGLADITQLETATDETSSKGGPVETAIYSSGVAHRAFDAKLLHAYRMLIEALPTDPDRWEDAGHAFATVEHEVQADTTASNRLNRIIFPVFDQAAEAVGQMQAHRRLSDTALRLLLDRARTGRLPDTLPDYGPSRIDPFSGHPLEFRHEGNGFLLYSFGPDRKDDGGKPHDLTPAKWKPGEPAPPSSEDYDIPLRIH